MVLYRLTDDRGMPLGVFTTIDAAKEFVPEADRWVRAKDGDIGDLDGWRADYSLNDHPHFQIRAVGAV